MDKNSHETSLLPRVKSTILMFIGFFIFITGGQLAMVILGVLLNIMMYKELVSIARNKEIKNERLYSKNFHWYLFATAFYYFYGEIFFLLLVKHKILGNYFMQFIKFHLPVYYTLFLAGFVCFVISLRRGYYRYQFKILAISYMTLFMINAQIYLLYKLMLSGSIWVIFPILLNCVNDIFAYIVGKLIGKTRLIILSPKKTWEGYIGGAIMTISLSVFIADYLSKFTQLICPSKSLVIYFPHCVPSDIFTKELYQISIPYFSLIKKFVWFVPDSVSFRFSAFLMHSFFISVLVAFIGPMGGFFASGFKRAFKIKNFGDSIPGHGGFTDRLDCLPLVSIIVYAYKLAFMKSTEIDTNLIFSMFLKLSMDEKTALFEQIGNYLSA